jgi:hypothetical protein
MSELGFTEAEIEHMLTNLDAFSPEEVAEIDKLVDELNNRRRNEAAYADLIEFCKHMQPDYIVGKHHRMLADMLMDIEQGNKDRICVNIPRVMVNRSLCPLCFQRGSLVGTRQRRL